MLSVNLAPSFVAPSGTIGVMEDAPLQTYTNWATQISAGSPEEAAQELFFTATTDNVDMFSTPPVMSANGTLQFAVAPGASGHAHVSVVLHDLGGTADGGVDTSTPHDFDIQIIPANFSPTIASLNASTRIATDTGASFTLTAVDVKDIDGPVANVRFYEDANDNGFLDAYDPMIGLGVQSGAGWSLDVTREGTGSARYFVQASDEAGLNSNICDTTVDFTPVSLGKVSASASTMHANKAYKLTAVSVSGAASVEFYCDTNGNGVIDDGDRFLGEGTEVGNKWQLVAPVTGAAEVSAFAKKSKAAKGAHHNKKAPTPITFLVRGVSAEGNASLTKCIHATIV